MFEIMFSVVVFCLGMYIGWAHVGPWIAKKWDTFTEWL